MTGACATACVRMARATTTSCRTSARTRADDEAHIPVDFRQRADLRNAPEAFLLGTAPSVAKPDVVLGTSAALTLALGGFANTALALMSMFLIVIHLGFASATALASAMIPIVISVLQSVQTPGINIVGMTMLLQFVVSFGFILPVNAPQNMLVYGTDTFTARDFIKVGLVITVLSYALLMLMGATYWSWLGYV